MERMERRLAMMLCAARPSLEGRMILPKIRLGSELFPVELFAPDDEDLLPLLCPPALDAEPDDPLPDDDACRPSGSMSLPERVPEPVIDAPEDVDAEDRPESPTEMLPNSSTS